MSKLDSKYHQSSLKACFSLVRRSQKYLLEYMNSRIKCYQFLSLMNFFHLFLFRGCLSSFKKGDRRVQKSLQFFNYQSLLKFYSFSIYI